MIGEIISGYKIIGNINDCVVLAYNPKAVEPWVVWWIDRTGSPYSGSYFSNRESAANEFILRGSFTQ